MGLPRRLLGLAFVLAVGTGLVTPAGVGAEQVAPSPALTVNPLAVSAGDKITVTGTGWPGSQMVDLSVCGNGGEGGSASCNRSGAASVGVGEDGVFGATLLAVVPPVACPCVVRGTSGAYSAVQALDVIGAPLRTAPAAIAVPIVDAIGVEGSGPPSSWFGGSPERDVSVSVSNPSAGVVRDARVEIRWGSSGSEQSRILDVGEPIAASSSVVVTTTIALGALTWGDVEVRARVLTTGEPTWVSTSTSSYPWGLIVGAFVLLQVIVIIVVRRNRRRRREREAELAAMDDGDVLDGSGAVSLGEPVSEPDTESGPPDAIDGDPAGAPAPVDAGLVGAVTAAAGGSSVGTIDRTETETDGEQPSSTAVQQPMTGPVTAAPWTRPRR